MLAGVGKTKKQNKDAHEKAGWVYFACRLAPATLHHTTPHHSPQYLSTSVPAPRPARIISSTSSSCMAVSDEAWMTWRLTR
jgi:hypothetical protein